MGSYAYVPVAERPREITDEDDLGWPFAVHEGNVTRCFLHSIKDRRLGYHRRVRFLTRLR